MSRINAQIFLRETQLLTALEIGGECGWQDCQGYVTIKFGCPIDGGNTRIDSDRIK